MILYQLSKIQQLEELLLTTEHVDFQYNKKKVVTKMKTTVAHKGHHKLFSSWQAYFVSRQGYFVSRELHSVLHSALSFSWHTFFLTAHFLFPWHTFFLTALFLFHSTLSYFAARFLSSRHTLSHSTFTSRHNV